MKKQCSNCLHSWTAKHKNVLDATGELVILTRCTNKDSVDYTKVIQPYNVCDLFKPVFDEQ